MLTFVERIQPYGLFDEAIEDRQLTDCLVVYLVFEFFNLTSNELDILWTSTEFQENKMKILTLVQPSFRCLGFRYTYNPWLVSRSKPNTNQCLSHSKWSPIIRIL